MTRIYFIRHGESKSNVSKSFTGQTDSELTELGRKQAELTAKLLENIKFDAAYSSDLSRAMDTCTIIANGKVDVIKDKNLREIFGGKWEKMRFDDIALRYPDDFADWHDRLGCACPTGGESVRKLYERINTEVMKIARLHAGKTVLLATHAMPIRCVMCKAQGVLVEDISRIPWVPNSSVSIFDIEGENYTAVQIGYADHLTGMITKLPDNI